MSLLPLGWGWGTALSLQEGVRKVNLAVLLLFGSRFLPCGFPSCTPFLGFCHIHPPLHLLQHSPSPLLSFRHALLFLWTDLALVSPPAHALASPRNLPVLGDTSKHKEHDCCCPLGNQPSAPPLGLLSSREGLCFSIILSSSALGVLIMTEE